MAKKNCRKSVLEKQQHEKAVKIRKMTDEQLCDFIDEISVQPNSLRDFFDRLEELKGSGNGISTGTIYKLKRIAIKEGLLTEETV